jgi:hypothetical protein
MQAAYQALHDTMIASNKDEYEKQFSVFCAEAYEGDTLPVFMAAEEPELYPSYTGTIVESSWLELPVDAKALEEGREPPVAGCYEPVPRGMPYKELTRSRFAAMSIA